MAIHKPIKTDLQLSKLKPDGATYDVPVAIAPGLVVRVSSAGSKTFRWDRGRAHQPRIITYGTYPSVSLGDAVKEHDKLKQRHKDGVDLSMGDEVPKTVAELAELFYRDRILPVRKVPTDVRRTLDTDILPALGRLRLRSVTTLAIRSMVRKVVLRGAETHAGKVLAHTKQLFRYGVSIGAMDFSPADSLEKVDLGVEDNRRNRTLSGTEIKLLHEALLHHSKMSLAINVALRTLLIVPLRSGELRQARWSDLDQDAETLTVPVAHQKLNPKAAKTAKPFVTPLPRQAMAYLKELQGADPVWIFPSRKQHSGVGEVDERLVDTAIGPVTDKSFGLAVRRLLMKRHPNGELVLPLDEPFSPHDLRRTCRTGLSALKIAPHIAERCLNHSLGRITETYDTHDYLDERRAALQKWADQVDRYVTPPANVIDLASKREAAA
jgi:integrase